MTGSRHQIDEDYNGASQGQPRPRRQINKERLKCDHSKSFMMILIALPKRPLLEVASGYPL
jgi:hypothetical protein